GSEEL
ncbi:hypothetical protein BN1708_020387, partial [Verticillium longisporum]